MAEYVPFLFCQNMGTELKIFSVKYNALINRDEEPCSQRSKRWKDILQIKEIIKDISCEVRAAW
jgi:hypothetical protein